MPSVLITPQDLSKRLDDPHLRILDCRHRLTDPQWGLSEYSKGHIPGAVHAHIDRDLSGPIGPKTGRHPLPDPVRFQATMGRFGVDVKTHVVVHDDQGGVWAARAWWLLRDHGHDNVFLLDGGIAAWKNAGLPLATKMTTPPLRTFKGSPGHMPRLDAPVIQQRLADPRLALLDARAGERYRGEVEPIDPVAGHIPGAGNLPALSLSGPDGHLLPARGLRARFEMATRKGATETVAYCGSGVTGSLLVLAAEVAGLPRLALYPGSWSEWIRDPARPVEKGVPPSTNAKPKAT